MRRNWDFGKEAVLAKLNVELTVSLVVDTVLFVPQSTLVLISKICVFVTLPIGHRKS